MTFRTISRKHFVWLYNHVGKLKTKILNCFLLNISAVMLSLIFVEITKVLIEGVEGGKKFSLLWLLFSLAIIKGCDMFCSEFNSYLRNKISHLMSNDLSLLFFKKLLASSVFYREKIHSGDAITRLTTDVDNVSHCLVEIIPGLLYAFVQLLATCIYLMSIEPILTLAIFFIMPINILVGQFYSKRVLPISREIRICDGKVNQFMLEHLQHHELIVTLDKASFIWNRLKSLQSVLYRKFITRIKLNSITTFLTGAAFEISYIIIFAWGIYGIQNNTFSYAELVVFLQLVGQVQLPFIQFNSYYPSFISSIASVEQLMEIENMPKEDTSNSIMFSSPVGIEISNINFRYSENSCWIYREFDYNFVPNSITAVVGETGAGKSTLLRLLLAVLIPNSGSITFYGNENGTLKKYVASPSTRGNCVYVPQGNSLISGTIRYNLLLGKTDATDKEMEDALYAAAAEFVFKDLPNGLDTTVGEGGVGISEGQAQRIAIARGFLRPGKVILMDEPTSALDIDTEKAFLMRLASHAQDKTIIIVTHKQEICDYVSNVVKIELLRGHSSPDVR